MPSSSSGAMPMPRSETRTLTSPPALPISTFTCALGIGIAHGIIKQHQEKLPEPCRIAAHHVVRPMPLAKAMSTAFGVGDHLGVAAHLLEQIAEIDGLQVEARGAGALAGDEQKVVHQHGQVLRLLDDALDRALVFGDPLVGATQRDLAFAANDGERRAQLVADVGEESRAASRRSCARIRSPDAAPRCVPPPATSRLACASCSAF